MNTTPHTEKAAGTIELSGLALRSHNPVGLDARLIELVKLLARQAAQEDFRQAATPPPDRLH